MIDAGAFEVQSYDKLLITEQRVNISPDAQTVIGGDISVTIPAGALIQNETLTIEQINNPHTINLPESVTGYAFSVTIGDMHQFNDTLYIDYRLPTILPGEPSAAYFDEETSVWDTLPSEVINGQLRIYTDHLTDFIVFYWGKAIYSSEGYFKIYYQDDDTHNYGSSMDDLAKMIGEALEEARKDYNVLPKAYQEDFSYLGFKDSMDVYIDSNSGDATYNPTTNNIILPTDFKDIDDLETTSAHELFHAYQDSVWNEIKLIGTMAKSENKWAVEALAELAAYELAFPEKQRERLLIKNVNSQSPFNTVDFDHEYNMSCFLKYLLKKTDSNFQDLWIYVVDSTKSTLSVCIDDFFKTKSSTYISLDMSYMDFWRAVLSDSNAPSLLQPENQFSKRKIYFLHNQHTGTFTYTGGTSTIAFNLFDPRTFSENMPTRIFNVTTLDQGNYSVLCTKLSGLSNPKEINNFRIPDGYPWERLYSDPSLGDDQLLYTLEQGKQDMVLIALESVIGGSLYGVNVSEVQGQCTPLKIEKVLPGKQQEFKIAFKDIFDYVEEVELVIDFGDGTSISFSKSNDDGTFAGSITHTFEENIAGKAVTFSLYNVTQGNKELISNLVVPMTLGEAVTLTASPSQVKVNESISYSTNISDTDYTYLWNFGDGQTDQTMGIATTSHIYDKPGTYTAKVTITDTDDKPFGDATVIISVEALEEEPEEDITADNIGDIQNTDDTKYEPDIYNGTHITDLELRDLGGRWDGIAIPTGFVNLDNFTYGSSEKLTPEMVNNYLSIIGKEIDFILTVDSIYETLSVEITHNFGNEFGIWFYDYSNSPVLEQGQLTGKEDIPEWYKSDINGTISVNEEGKLVIQGTVDIVDYISHFGEGEKQYEISYSYTFMAIKEH